MLDNGEDDKIYTIKPNPDSEEYFEFARFFNVSKVLITDWNQSTFMTFMKT